MTRDISDRSIYLCVPDRSDLERFLASCIAGGVDVVQLRDKTLEARDIVARASLARKVCRDLGVPFILNDRPDLALDVDADGVHVGQDDASVGLARRIVGADRIVGLSTHARSEFERGLTEDADYLSAGPIVPTPTKPGRPATGISYVAEAAELAGSVQPPRPFFVTGGASPETIPTIVDAGASRVVVVRYLTESDDPRRAATKIREALLRALERSGQQTRRGAP